MCLVLTEKTASDPLEPELQMIVGHHVCAGNKPGLLQEQQMLLTAEPSPQPPKLFTVCCVGGTHVWESEGNAGVPSSDHVGLGE